MVTKLMTLWDPFPGALFYLWATLIVGKVSFLSSWSLFLCSFPFGAMRYKPTSSPKRQPFKHWKMAGFLALLPSSFPQPLPRRHGSDSVHHPLNVFLLRCCPFRVRCGEPISQCGVITPATPLSPLCIFIKTVRTCIRIAYDWIEPTAKQMQAPIVFK